MDNGIVGEVEAAGIAPGTQIDVLNLFAKVPARLSFQRRPSTETAAIVDVGVQMALAEPNAGIFIEVDGRKDWIVLQQNQQKTDCTICSVQHLQN